MAYTSILEWINFPDPMSNPYYPFGVDYNMPYDMGMKIWDILGGSLAWLLSLLFGDNAVSNWLVCDATSNFFALLFFALLVFIVVFIGVLLCLWEERKVLGRGMDRHGTMIGMMGFLQCVGDGFKTFMKANVIPRKIDKMAYMWSLALLIGMSCLVACMVPLSNRWFVVNYDTGLLLVMGLLALAPFFVMVSGWAQNNKYSFIGGLRAAEMMVAYEVPMLILMATVALQAGTFNINGIVQAQYDTLPYIVTQALGFLTFFVCGLAEVERTPFDLAEAESELVAGWQTEYAGMKWGLIMLGDYLRGFCVCGMIVILYLGGWNLPGWNLSEWTFWWPLPEAVFLFKGMLVFLIMIIVRIATPRVRIDTIVNMGWKVFMPLAVINLVFVIMMKAGGIFV